MLANSGRRSNVGCALGWGMVEGTFCPASAQYVLDSFVVPERNTTEGTILTLPHVSGTILPVYNCPWEECQYAHRSLASHD